MQCSKVQKNGKLVYSTSYVYKLLIDRYLILKYENGTIY